MKKINFKELFTFIILTLVIGFFGGILGNTSNYQNLLKPSFSPPAYVFPIVWTLLYILMGISLYIAYNKSLDKNILKIYIIQLIVNIIWPLIFFRLEFRFLAFIWIILLIILATIMTVKFYKIKPISGLIQIPYILWLIFAMILNYYVYILNK